MVTALKINRYIILASILFLYLFLGCIMDSMAIMLLVTPIFFPVILSLGFDPIWFGIMVTRVTEIGMITPPVGINVFVIQGVAKDIPMGTIYRGITPFLAADIVHVSLLIAVPQIALILPGLMR
jgi:TRAP-type C4-dicarboxylate transport system permease large subunit